MNKKLSCALASLPLLFCPIGSAQDISSSAFLEPLSQLSQLNEFGVATAISGDYLLVGDPNTYITGAPPGAPKIYRRTLTGEWVKDVDLPLPPAVWDFGRGVALQGDLAAVSSPTPLGGLVHIFRKGVSGWVLEAALTDPILATYGSFGSGLAFSGNQLLVTDPMDSSLSAPVASGVIHVYEYSSPATWTHAQVLQASDFHSSAFFGLDIDVEGSLLAVGTQHSVSAYGVAYVFERDLLGMWTEVAKVTDPLGVASNYFGRSVDIAGDLLFVSDVLEIAAQGRIGTVTIHERSAAGTYSFKEKLVSPLGLADEIFGHVVEARGDQLFVGAFRDPFAQPGSNDLGYVFEQGPNGWVHSVHLVEGQHLDPAGIPYQTDSKMAPVFGDDELLLPMTLYSGGINFFFNVGVFDVDELIPALGSLSLSAGGAQALYLRPGMAHAGETFITLGSMSGTSQGTPLPGGTLTLPLALDAYTMFLLTSPAASTYVQGGVGVLDAKGFGKSTVLVPSGLSPALAGLTLHHAYALIGQTGFTFVSGAEPLVLEM